jgi:hypothetical protein
MIDTTVRAIIQAPSDASNGGGPDDGIVRASEMYADDAVLEWPQGGERLRGTGDHHRLPVEVPGPPAVRSAPDHRLPRPLGRSATTIDR